ncbi:RNase P and RNase MRP subunit [Marasmius crinis-equi]|uniref:RNase P and RNase MRP subunit n=1 Tax=Marasmius crinis-equi TaxID=585013 RepID=A0ABR3FF65_9AGAR
MPASVKVHTNQSNRAKPADGQKKVVFKPVLDNPFRVYWPSIPVNLQNLILAQTVTLLDGVSTYQSSRSLANRKRKREKRQGEQDQPNKKRKETEVDMTVDAPENASLVAQDDSIEPTEPQILSHITIGINAVTKRLESHLSQRKQKITITSSTPEPVPTTCQVTPVRVVLACRADVNPPVIIDHIPHIIAAYNSSLPPNGEDKPILLIPLSSGAEYTLSDALGLRRVAVLALDSDAPNLESLIKDNIPIVSAPWLAPPLSNQQKQLVPTHIKQLRTTAPKDMKVAKEQRAAGRKEAKERKKQEKTAQKVAK